MGPFQDLYVYHPRSRIRYVGLNLPTVTLNFAKQNFGCNTFPAKYDQAEDSRK